MKISAQISIVIAAIFAVICFSVAITGFSAIGNMTDATKIADAKGFAWFWAFLGIISVIFGVLGIWIVRTHKESDGG